jgi:hypothetical protein
MVDGVVFGVCTAGLVWRRGVGTNGNITQHIVHLTHDIVLPSSGDVVVSASRPQLDQVCMRPASNPVASMRAMWGMGVVWSGVIVHVSRVHASSQQSGVASMRAMWGGHGSSLVGGDCPCVERLLQYRMRTLYMISYQNEHAGRAVEGVSG